MTKEQFNNIKLGDIISDNYNGLCRVNGLGFAAVMGSDGEYSKKERSFDCEYVNYDGNKKEWYLEGANCFDVTETEATETDEARWDVMDKEELKDFMTSCEEEWN